MGKVVAEEFFTDGGDLNQFKGPYEEGQKELRAIGEFHARRSLTMRQRTRLKEEPHLIAHLSGIRARSKSGGAHRFQSAFFNDSWINCNRAQWDGTWINPFSSLGEEAAACLVPPDPRKWHRPTYDVYCNSGQRDPKLKAIFEGHLGKVKADFKKPEDLNRWEIDGVDSAHGGALELAFGAMNVDILDHLLRVAPVPFMQQITMKTSTFLFTANPLGHAFSIGRRSDKAEKLLAVVKWVCASGVMTDTIFADVYFELGLAATVPGVTAELDRWYNLPADEKRMLTEERFSEILEPAIQKQLVNATVNGSSIECFDISGKLLQSFDINTTRDARTLVSRLATTIGTGQHRIRVIAPSGQDVLTCDPAAPLSKVLS